LIGADGEQVGIEKTENALRAAEDLGLDLVEISPNADPPVCRIMDYGKFLYEDSKRKAAARKNQKKIQVKEIKFRPGQFLEDGDKTKVTIRFRGREMAHKELGRDLLKRIEKDLEEYGSVEQFPELQGRQMIMVLAPVKR